MNYIIFSIVLLVVIIIIIYILSIDNNIDKFKNKIKEVFSVVKSKKINYLNDKDNKNLLLYIKQHFNNNNNDNIDNITIPSKIFYNKTERGYEMNNINIICYKYTNNNFEEIPHTINILFVPFEKENYISNQSLLGLHGNYMINIIDKLSDKLPKILSEPINLSEKTVKFDTHNTFIQNNNKNDYNNDNHETYTDVLDMIPDIINLTEDDSIITTDTEQLISHNFK
jgi:hypothetical protein